MMTAVGVMLERQEACPRSKTGRLPYAGRPPPATSPDLCNNVTGSVRSCPNLGRPCGPGPSSVPANSCTSGLGP